MKNILYTVLFVIIFSFLPEKINAQLSTQGTDFWLAFGQNRLIEPASINLQIRIIAEEPTEVKLTYTENGSFLIHNMSAGEIWTYDFPGTLDKQRVYTKGGGNISSANNKSLHITSDKPVYVFAMTQQNITTDATNVLPVGCLGTDYYHISYKANPSWYDGYTIVVTENGTNIFENGAPVASNLAKGQAFHRWPNSFRGTDKTGLHITSNKPVAYFTTNGGVFIPKYLINGADCLFQQLLPVNTWGTKFMVPVTHRGFVRARVLASQDNTTVQFSGGYVTNDDGYSKYPAGSPPPYILNKGEFMEIHSLLKPTTTLPIYAGNGTYIEADKPVAVTTYLVGRDYVKNGEDDGVKSAEKGDPSMTWVPPIEQAVENSRIAPFTPNGYSAIEEHYALLTVPTAHKNLTTLQLNNGTQDPLIPTFPNEGWYDHPSGYSFYSKKLDTIHTDSYFFENQHGITILCYGFGEYESYYYLSAAASRRLDLSFYYKNESLVDSIHYQDLDGRVFCDDTVAKFNAVVRYAMEDAEGYMKWYVNDVENVSARDNLSWDTIFPAGSYTVKLVVVGLSGETDSVSSTFTIAASQHITLQETICLGERYTYPDTINAVFDTMPASTGLYIDSVYLKSVDGCDSIIKLELTVLPVYDTTITDTICLGDRYAYPDTINAVFDTIPTVPGLFIDSVNLQTVDGCDSILIFNITVFASYDTLIIDTVCFGTPYTNSVYSFFDTIPASLEPIVWDTTLHTVIGGCDSIVRLELTVLPVYDTLIIDTVCFGDTYTNSVYSFFDTIPVSLDPIIWDTILSTVIGGCDSIVRLNLTVLSPYDTLITDAICLGDRYDKYGFTIEPTQLGLNQYSQNLTRINGCDSIINLNLTVNPTYNVIINADVCSGDNYNANGFDISVDNPGFYTYQHDYKTANNCDSIVTLQLTVNPTYNDYVSARIYEDEFYKIGNYQYSTPGLHVSVLRTIADCDSIVTLNLDVIYYPSETAFSPFNKDGINDYFMPGFKIQIFNRYGALIYETKTPEDQALGWDGRNSNGKIVEPGTYFYILYNSSNKPRLKSSVEILKR
ncbi:MAG: gliding motility-associated C-terminal domain-containing protein [Prevotellaceae bacterium]|jgi:gliding motility-associated-like protein|nr:gliding motility-associated C-terminal domain-containing protein [Prevotellaceae bacterium]